MRTKPHKGLFRSYTNMIHPPQKTVNPVRSDVSNWVNPRNKVEPPTEVQPWCGKGESSLGGLTLIGLLVTVSFFAFAVPTAQAVVGKPPNNLGLVGYWSMDECRGNIALDSSGNSNRGTLTNFALSGSTSNWVSGSAAKRGCALNFDGTDDYVNIGDVVDIGTNDMSISMWFKTPITVTNKALIAKEGGVFPSWGLYSVVAGAGYSEGAINLQFLIDNDNRINDVTNVAFSDNNWHHLVWIVDRDVTTGTVYVDGVSRGFALVTHVEIGRASCRERV